MARTVITKKAQARYQDGLASNETRIDFAASDASNNNYVDKYADNLQVYAKNTHASASKNYIIVSVPDNENRSGDLTIPLAAGETALLPPLSRSGFVQANGQLWLNGEDANISFAVIVPRS